MRNRALLLSSSKPPKQKKKSKKKKKKQKKSKRRHWEASTTLALEDPHPSVFVHGDPRQFEWEHAAANGRPGPPKIIPRKAIHHSIKWDVFANLSKSMRTMW